jgi:tetratricopeptide (TPR) repeat protein
MRKIIPYCFLFFPFFTKGQDTLVYFHELSFSSVEERTAFNLFLNKNQKDYFNLFSQAGKNPSALSKEKFYTYLNKMGYEKMVEKKQDKRVKFIYENVHSAFLSKYVAKSLFSDIFENGDYNCVSATALYCMAFDYFKIPYVIKEKPNHVYPVAYPSNQQVIVETTNPMVGSFAFNDQFKASYLENLKKQKVISNQEAITTSNNELFDRYFFKEELNINMDQLFGIQYMNDGIFKLEAEDVNGSFKQFEKAYLLYPSENIANGLLVSYLKAFQIKTKKDTSHAILLAKLARFSKYGITQELIKGEFGTSTNSLLFEQGKPTDYTNYFNALNNHLKDSELREEVSFIYYYEHGRYYYNQGKYFQSQPYFEKAFSIRPNNQDVQNTYLQIIERSLRAASDAQEAIKLLIEASDKNPVLTTNNKFNSMLAATYLAKFNDDYQIGRVQEGEKGRLAFESIYTKEPDLTINPEFIGQAYSTAAVYYFRKNQTSKSRFYIDKGLEFVPGNKELLNRKKYLN